MYKINSEVSQETPDEESHIFEFECPFCGVEEQKWLWIDEQSSRCMQCKVVGSNSWQEVCPICSQENYVFTISNITKCFECWNKE